MGKRNGERREVEPVADNAADPRQTYVPGTEPIEQATQDGVELDVGDGITIAEDMSAVKARWLQRRQEIESHRSALEELEAAQSADAATIAGAAIHAAKNAATEAVVQVGAYRMRAKRRPAKHGGGVMLVDAPIAAALDI